MNIFNDQDIEAAAKAIWEARYKAPTWATAISDEEYKSSARITRKSATAALTAALASLEKRGAFRIGRGWIGDNEGGWTADTQNYSPDFDEEFLAAIIKLPTPPMAKEK